MFTPPGAVLGTPCSSPTSVKEENLPRKLPAEPLTRVGWQVQGDHCWQPQRREVAPREQEGLGGTVTSPVAVAASVAESSVWHLFSSVSSCGHRQDARFTRSIRLTQFSQEHATTGRNSIGRSWAPREGRSGSPGPASVTPLPDVGFGRLSPF